MTRRYFLVKVVSDGPVSGEQFAGALTGAIRRYFGEVGLSRIEPKLIRFDLERSEAVVACKKEGAGELEGAMALISNVSGSSIALLTVRASGTIKSLRKKTRKQHF